MEQIKIISEIKQLKDGKETSYIEIQVPDARFENRIVDKIHIDYDNMTILFNLLKSSLGR